MTRLISGVAGGRRLKVPRTGVRPTGDRAREALFNSLKMLVDLRGAAVLDLYAGSGALGLEAASRGAAHVTLVDRVYGASAIAKTNVAKVTGAAPRGTKPTIVVSSQPVQSFLGGATGVWDVVFLDPPYELGGLELVHNLEALVPRLSRDAVVVVERSSRDRAPEWPDGLELDRRKDYGDTALYWLSPSDTPSDDRADA